jgi:preprotein translocase subunit SecE
MGIVSYVQSAKGELRHVSWPTRKQVISFTALVVAISLFVAAYLGILDYLFTSVFQTIVR